MARKKLGLEERVAGRIRQFREEQGMSQADLARALKTSRSYVSEIEGLKKVPSIKVLGTFAAALGVPPEELVSSKPSNTRPDAADALARALRERGPAYVKLVKSMLPNLDRIAKQAD